MAGDAEMVVGLFRHAVGTSLGSIDGLRQSDAGRNLVGVHLLHSQTFMSIDIVADGLLWNGLPPYDERRRKRYDHAKYSFHII